MRKQILNNLVYLLLISVISGCGLKGPLYQPKPSEQEQNKPAQEPTQQPQSNSQ